MEEESIEADIREQKFHSTVREYIIFLLLFIALYTVGYLIIGKFRRKDREDFFSTDEEEATVYRISLWLCSFALSVCLCACLLLPFSIASNEVLLLYPSSFYVKWLNHSLVQGLWNLVFLFSNLSLFFLLPFAYFFTESEGFLGYQKGVMSRVYETLAVLSLLILILLGFTYVVSALLKDTSAFKTFFYLWSYYLPFLYSCISFLGALLLLLCTPLGFGRLFSIVSGLLVKPQFMEDLNQEFFTAKLEEECYRRRLEQAVLSGDSYATPAPMCPSSDARLLQLRNGALQAGLTEGLAFAEKQRLTLERRRQRWGVRRVAAYPACMLGLLLPTAATVLLGLCNTVELLIGIKALPIGTRQFTLGAYSLSKVGVAGAVLEVVLILYLAAASAVGLYSMPLLRRIVPRPAATPFPHVIANCALLLVLSSALPLLTRTLGITNFDLLGEYGQIEWLGNFAIVLLYNLAFACLTLLILFNSCSRRIRQQLYARFRSCLDGSDPGLTRTTRASLVSTKED